MSARPAEFRRRCNSAVWVAVAILRFTGCGDERMERIAREVSEFNTALVRETVLAGDIEQTDAIKQVLTDTPGIMRADMLAAYAGASIGAPNLDLQTRLDLARSAGLAATVGLNRGDVKEIARLAAALRGLPPATNARDSVDLALVVYKRLRDASRDLTPFRIDAVRYLIESAKQPKEKALLLAVEGIADGNPDLIIRIRRAVEHPAAPADPET